MRASVFHSCTFDGVDFSGADMRGAKLEDCDLTNATLLGILVNSKTRFEQCETSHAYFERHILESLDEYGGLTKGQRMRLRIVDGALILRRAYTGFWQWVHLLALILFLSPYAFLLLRYGLTSSSRCPVDAQCATLLSRLLESIYTGGAMNGQMAFPQLAIFGFLLFYNMLRVILLYKAKTLELQETSSGLPVVFSWSGFWKRLYDVTQIAFWLNIVLAIVHAILFLHRAVVVQ
jgi:hypothetical protein